MDVVSEDRLFKNSVYLKGLVGKVVKIDTDENCSYTGKVYVIDPIYRTVVLHCQTLDESPAAVSTIFILRHAIKALEILSDTLDSNYLSDRNNSQLMVDSDDQKRRLKKWLQQRLMTVQDKGEYLKIEEHLIILPPYTIDNCICNNTIVLDRIRTIIEAMPEGFN